MSTTTTLSGHLVTECDACDASGKVSVQDAGRREPWLVHDEVCPACHGECWVPLWCVYCGSGVEAVVVDSDGMPKCRESYEEDHPGRPLPGAA